jgi:NAD dependent epimerase/dehydratase family enzyme
LNTPAIHGPVNLVAPQAIRNHDFTQQIGRILFRPTLVPFPSFMVKLLFGEMGKALLLSSAKVIPAKLRDTGYEFLFPLLQQSLCFELGYSHTERAE